MNPQIILNFNLATKAEQLAESQAASGSFASQSLPSPFLVTASASEAAEVSLPVPADYDAAASATSSALPTPLGLETAQSDTGIVLPVPIDTTSATYSVAEQTAPTPFNAIETALAAVKGGIPTPLDIQEYAAISAIVAVPEPTALDQSGSGQRSKASTHPEPKDLVEPTGSDFQGDNEGAKANKGKAK